MVSIEEYKKILEMLHAGQDDADIAFSNLENTEANQLEYSLIYKLCPLRVKRKMKSRSPGRILTLKECESIANENQTVIINYIKDKYSKL